MDFSNRQNRLVRLSEVPQSYLEEIHAMAQNDPFYPSYHIAPKHGLMNDPNGLSYFNGEHHLFYQWFPLGPVHGLKHWYHVSTKDFVNYKDRGIALYPDEVFDEHGCYTGIGLPQGDKLALFYTGNRFEDGVPVQTQVLAYMDKEGKIEKRGVVVPHDATQYTCEFRDPVIFERGETPYMLVGAQGHDEKGKLALYKGESFEEYQYLGNVDIGGDDFGFMWECPNYYEQDDKGILIFSPQGVTSESKYDLKNVFSVVYMIGAPIDTDSLSFDNSGYIELDKGFDFYAPQIYLDEQGRRIMYAWLGNSKSAYPTDKNYWAHMMTLPRELRIVGDRIAQFPLPELEGLREKTEILEDSQTLQSGAFELELGVVDSFSFELCNDAGDKVTFSGSGEEYCLDRSQSTHLYAEQFGQVRFAKRRMSQQSIRVFVDNSSLEIFCDKGETVFTSRIFIQDINKLVLKGAQGQLHYLKSNQFTE